MSDDDSEYDDLEIITSESIKKSIEPWEAMEDCPTTVSFKPIPLNHMEFLVVSDRDRSIQHFARTKDRDTLLYKYNIYSKQWTGCMKYPDRFPHFTGIAMDQQNNEIYFFSATFLMKIDLSTQKLFTLKESHAIGDVGKEPSIICIRDELHIVGGDKNKCHYIFNTRSLEIELIHEFEAFHSSGFSSHSLIYLESTETLLLMGGYDDHERGWMGGPVETIFMYSIPDKKWLESSCKLPTALYRYAYAVTNNGALVVLIGGNPSSPNSDIIYVMDVKEMKFANSEIKFPVLLGYSKVHAVTLCCDDKDEYLVSGFLRNFSRLFEINIPLDVVQLIGLWIREDFVYAVSESGKMWRIKLNDLISVETVESVTNINDVINHELQLID